uniref:Alpha-carbonic anhydrase domain-containing protein n=1 Tax=Erpetoichthys calabaricus TaxID=27687 RepID=A0A8C4XCS4_ERPCA
MEEWKASSSAATTPFLLLQEPPPPPLRPARTTAFRSRFRSFSFGRALERGPCLAWPWEYGKARLVKVIFRAEVLCDPNFIPGISGSRLLLPLVHLAFQLFVFCCIFTFVFFKRFLGTINFDHRAFFISLCFDVYSDMRRLLEPCCWWIISLILSFFPFGLVDCHPARTEGQVGFLRGRRHGAGPQMRQRRASSIPYWAYSGTYGPDSWASHNPDCRGKNQSPIDIVDQDAKVSLENQELFLEGFEVESSNKTWMKNTGKTVAILLKDDYFVRGAGLPGRFKAEKVEFHWGQSNASAGSEHSINGRRFPVETQKTAF